MGKRASIEKTRRVAAAEVSAASKRGPYEVPVERIAASVAELRTAERRAMTAEAAYFRAERRGFTPGHEVEDWLAAELELMSAQQREAGTGFQK